ncbi:MAG TPA: AMP-binding protein [Mycobacteriales bacterium]|nr:AMP-binding protein [Mycobacteriales bacterium]
MRPLRASVPDLALVRAALDGSGPALLTDPAAALAGPVDDEVCAIVPTSGSTGAPRGVELTAACLTVSARATAEVVGEGQWLLAVPPTHVAGLQVLVRSVLAGTSPVVLDGPTTRASFEDAAARMTGGHRLVALVPTQLRRLLGSPALRALDAVLLGGAAAPADLVEAARADGVRVVTTYGMTETSGGCVYDGVPLAGVTVEAGDRIVVRGPVVARGVLGGERFSGEVRTNDVGEWRDGRLVVLGRADDVVVTGGEKVAPAAVEDRLRAHPSVVDVAVVGVPDEEWGQRVVAVVVLRGPLGLEEARDHVAGPLPRAAAPRELRVVDALPLLPSGKIDRMRLRA